MNALVQRSLTLYENRNEYIAIKTIILVYLFTVLKYQTINLENW
jgi:hypothetical protein